VVIDSIQAVKEILFFVNRRSEGVLIAERTPSYVVQIFAARGVIGPEGSCLSYLGCLFVHLVGEVLAVIG
jgi:hypothetical protein